MPSKLHPSEQHMAAMKAIFTLIFVALYATAVAGAAPAWAIQPAGAQPRPALPAPSPPVPSAPAPAAPITLLDRAIALLPALMRGEVIAQEYFAPSFLTEVPASQFSALRSQLINAHGQPLRTSNITRVNSNTAKFRLEFERAFAEVDLTVAPGSGKVSGFFIRNITRRADSIEKIDAEFAALPGSAGFAVSQLAGSNTQRVIAGRKDDRQFAVASTFKLYTLAELSAQIRRGQRQWSDVTALSRRSFSSPATRNWPQDSPTTLQTLALQMIAMSDNSASDTLLFLLGRRAVEQRLTLIGHSNPARALPMLATTEAFAMKGNASLRGQYLSANEAGQYAILSRNAGKLDYDNIDPYVFSSQTPKHIDTLEWFASPLDITRLLNAIRAARDGRMLQILSANVGPAQSRRGQWNYIGYKGGSEPGVISMSYLMQAKDGRWYALTGSWNDAQRPVNEDKFAALMMRLMDWTAQR